MLFLRSTIFLFLIILSSCNNEEIRTTKELDKIFTKSEIKDINKLVVFFEKRISSTDSKLNQRYKNWIISISNLEDNTWDKFNFEDQLNIYKLLDKNTFNEIWQFNEMRYLESKDTLKHLNLAYDKKYHKYLTELGRNSEKMKWYSNKAYESGDLPQIMDLQNLFVTIDTINENHKVQSNYDFNEKLVITISSLKNFDNYHRREKWATK